MMVAAATWVLALAASSPPSPCVQSTTLGPDGADQHIDALIDPVDSDSWMTYVKLRRLVRERPGALQIDVYWVAQRDTADIRARLARQWLQIMAGLGAIERGLRQLARDGSDQLGVQLAMPDRRQALVKQLGIDVDQHERAWAQRCPVEPHLPPRIQDTLELREAAFRSPLFVTDAVAFEDGNRLSLLRTWLSETRHSPPDVRPPSRFDPALARRFSVGLFVGSPTNTDQITYVVRDEGDPLLSLLLPALALRRRDPLATAIQLVGTGLGPASERLRRRLCAAQSLGLGPAYLTWLAMSPNSRSPDEDVLARLDGAATDKEVGCSSPLDEPTALGWGPGVRLNGHPLSPDALTTIDRWIDHRTPSTIASLVPK